MMESFCRKSGERFEISADDLAFLERVSPKIGDAVESVPPVTLAPRYRAMRRLAWRNSNHLYRRQCMKTGAPIVSAYPSECPFPIYSTPVWWSDDWDQTASGRAVDLRRPFFEQFRELMFEAPRPAVMNSGSQNSEYCNYAGQNKNCYMANNGSWYNETCLFGEAYLRCRDCVDCSYVRGCELCYEVVGGDALYECSHCTDCHTSANCHFSFNLRGCRDCFLSCNLRNKVGYIRNLPASEAQLAALREQMKTVAGLAEMRAELEQLERGTIHPAYLNINCEESSGDYLTNCKNVRFSSIVGNIRDGKYLLHCDEAQDMWDCSLSGYAGSELYYETVSSGDGGSRALFCSGSWASHEVMYCDTVMSCRSCFGCIGLKRAENTVLNRSYTRKEYEHIVRTLIGHMRETGEWGEFFPEALAPHAYNESHAQDFYPLEQSQALTIGYRWKPSPPVVVAMNENLPPEGIAQFRDSFCDVTYSCRTTGRSFKIIRSELGVLRKLQIAPPVVCPEERRTARLSRRNKPEYYQRSCCVTGEPILTSYEPNRFEKVCSYEAYLSLLE
ncbi:MAG: hypothetical protein U0136_17970 [Bdellovibrionota bacterium]